MKLYITNVCSTPRGFYLPHTLHWSQTHIANSVTIRSAADSVNKHSYKLKMSLNCNLRFTTKRYFWQRTIFTLKKYRCVEIIELSNITDQIKISKYIYRTCSKNFERNNRKCSWHSLALGTITCVKFDYAVCNDQTLDKAYHSIIQNRVGQLTSVAWTYYPTHYALNHI